MSADRAGFVAPAAIDAGAIVDRQPQPVDPDAEGVAEGAFGFAGASLQEVRDAVSDGAASALYKLS